MLEISQIYNMDCRTGLRQLSSESTDLCVTSPPYKTEDCYSDELMSDVFTQLHRVLKFGSLFFLNFGHLAEDKMRPFKVCQIALDCGFQLNDTITWVKNHYRPIQGNKRLNNLTEFIFLLHKGKMSALDRLAIGIPYKDKSNAKRFANGRDLKCRGNVWHVDYETINSKAEKHHNDRFPLELPELCIKLSGIKDGVVIDPFLGSFTVACAAKKLGINYIGFEINKKYFEIGQKRLMNIV